VREDYSIRITVGNAGPDTETIDVLPTVWFRNTWSWGFDDRVPSLRADGGVVVAEHHDLGGCSSARPAAPSCCSATTSPTPVDAVDQDSDGNT